MLTTTIDEMVIRAPNFLEPAEEKIIAKISRKIEPDCKTVSLLRLKRVGWSGAKLFALYLGKDMLSWPLVVKVDDKTRIDSEYLASTRIHTHVGQAHAWATAQSGTLAGLAYRHVAGGNPREVPEPREFQDILVNEGYGIGGKQRVLNKTYKDLQNAHMGSRQEPVSPKDLYSRYLRSPRATIRIGRLVDGHSRLPIFEFLGAKILNPLVAMKGLPEKIELKVGLVHGDLHPKNIIVPKDGLQGIIDFAWSRSDMHVLVDFALMENSIRFFCFPQPSDPKVRLDVDDALLNEEGPSLLPELVPSDCPHHSSYLELAGLVSRVRAQARKVQAFVEGFDEYLLAQFLVLFGQFSYDGYASYETFRSLGLIAHRLWERDVIKLPSGTQPSSQDTPR